MKKIILFIFFMCLTFGVQAQNKSNTRKGIISRRATIVKKTKTPNIHKIVPMTKEQMLEYTKHMEDSIQMNGTNWECILKLPGLTKAEIYRFSKEYMGKSFTNWARSIQIDDAENYKIVCMGTLQTLVVKKLNPMDGQACTEIFNGSTRQTLTLDIKDEKVRVRGEGFAWTGKATLHIGNMSCDPSYYYGEGMLTMSMLVGEEENLAEGEAKFCEALQLGVLQYLTWLRNYILKAKLDDNF